MTEARVDNMAGCHQSLQAGIRCAADVGKGGDGAGGSERELESQLDVTIDVYI